MHVWPAVWAHSHFQCLRTNRGPRAVDACLNTPNTHAPRYFYVFDPELTSKDEGAPQEGRTKNARGGREDRSYRHHKPFSEYKNIGFYRSYGPLKALSGELF